MIRFFPVTGAETEWIAAYYRLEDYLRALHIVNPVHQNQIILSVVKSAAQKHAENSEESPTALVMQEIRDRMDNWFEKILARDERIEVAGLVAFLASDAPEKWPAEFLAEEISPEFQSAMQNSDVKAGPDLQVSSMVPRPLDESSLVNAAANLPRLWARVKQNVMM